jgi:hypothetical protein
MLLRLWQREEAAGGPAAIAASADRSASAPAGVEDL